MPQARRSLRPVRVSDRWPRASCGWGCSGVPDTAGWRVRAGPDCILLPPGPQFQVVRQELPQDVAASQVKESFQLIVVQAGTHRAGEATTSQGNKRVERSKGPAVEGASYRSTGLFSPGTFGWHLRI